MWQTALKKFEVIWSTLPDHITLDFLKAVFHKFYWSILEYFDPYNLGLLQSVFLVPRSFVREWRYFDELNCGKPYLLALSLTLCLIEIICVTWIIRIFFLNTCGVYLCVNVTLLHERWRESNIDLKMNLELDFFEQFFYVWYDEIQTNAF